MKELATFSIFILSGLIFAIVTAAIGACITNNSDDAGEILTVAWVFGVLIYAMTFAILYSPYL